MQHKALLPAIALALSPNLATAKTPSTDSVEKIVVVSSRVAMPLREIATSVSVVTKQDIDLRGYANLGDILKVQPAIGVTDSGGAGSTASLRVRGEEGYRTLVRIDGVDISDPTGTQVQPQFAHLQAANINRVEILRGSQGLAYGADAGGVINILSTQYTTGLNGSIAAEAGRYNTTKVNGDIGGRKDNLDYYLSGASFQTEGFNSRLDDTSQDADGYKNNTLHSRLGYQITDELSGQLVIRSNKGEGEFDNCGYGASATNDCQSHFEQTNFRASVNYNNDRSEHEISYSKSLVERENFKQNVSSFLTKGFTERAEYLGNTQLNAQHALIYGLDWEKESISSAQQYRYNRGYFVEYQGELVDNWYTTIGLRHDDNQDFGKHTTYRLSSAYIWPLGDDEIKLRGAYGTGFRAPSVFEVEYNRGPWAFPPASDTALKQEETKGYELGLAYLTKAGGHFEAVYFDQTIDNSIFFDLANSSGYLQDIGESFSKGIELIADIPLNDYWFINANYTYNRTEDTAGQQRARRPNNITNFGLRYQDGALILGASIRLVRNFIDITGPMDNYHLFDISARYQVNPTLSVYARVENALDHKYQDASTFYTSRQAPHIGLRMQF